ncbi:hypothetical protein SAMN05444166_1227 [Singulisphaera sp. GP187]|uniref:Ig-like domain-containing protein n=1 Tax=Singulisphaera sp. GP187 TaxID=1882752 RepID=UPI00092AE55B|nr:Ig-like domain-containing protein [Singulisphaera sp. GP187]SIN84328.1 hypothetical protein SAMN05444166_1227 [Singulisphaera sp. GP187]
MDRRRFVPSPEGLEGRAMLSVFGTANTAQANVAQEVPVTFQQKELRIEHLPFYLRQLQPNRFLPDATVRQLQDDLLSIAGRLHRPNPATLEAFNSTLQDIIPNASLSVPDAKTLSHAFQRVVGSTGATAQQVANLTQDMNDLARASSQSPQPVFLTTNDYSLVLQTILGVGRPIQRPPAPELALQDGTRVSNGIGKTTLRQPQFVGTYGAGSTVGDFAGNTGGGFNSNGVRVQIIDDQGTVYGQSVVDPTTGNYRVTIGTPLANGVYRFHARAVDAQGHESPPSQVYLLKVMSRPGENVTTSMATPKGPLAARK